MGAEFARQLAEVVQVERDRWGIPGIAIGILQDGEIIHKAGYGVVSLETQWPVTPDTLFMIASNSKVFTATLLMTLVDDGKVDLDAPLTTYLPDLKFQDSAALERVIVRHLLSHQTGLWGNNPQDIVADTDNSPDALQVLMTRMERAPQLYQPGELWAYTNINLSIAGALIEVVSGRLFEDLMRERVLDPLGLQRTFYGPWEIFGYPNAVGHVLRDLGSSEIEILRPYISPKALYPTGGLQSTVEDLLTFDRFHLGDGAKGRPLPQIISDEARLAMQEVQIVAANIADAQGLGWRIQQLGGARTIGHGGGWIGCITRNTVFPEHGTAFAIYTNSDRGSGAIDGIERWLAAEVLGLTQPERPKVTLPAGALTRLAGRYENPETLITVEVEGDRLRLLVTDTYAEPFEFLPAHYDAISELEFVDADGYEQEAHIDFIPGGDGSIRYMRHGSRVLVRQ